MLFYKGEAECSLLKRQVCKSRQMESLRNAAPFLKERVDRRTSVDSWFLFVWIWESMLMYSVWSLIICRRPRQSAWWKVESSMWISRNDGLCCLSTFIKEAIRRIRPSKTFRESFCGPAYSLLRHRPEFRRNLPTRELQGNSCRPWASAHLYMLEQRKTYGCNKYPFYKNFPHPDSNLKPRISNLSFLYSPEGFNTIKPAFKLDKW